MNDINDLAISIVTPSYNQGAFLAEAIESVIGQEGDFALDYLVMDGGSSDSSVRIIRDYETRLRTGQWPVRCRGISFSWVSEPDRGQTDALMKGFRRSRGAVLGWLNSDDIYLPGALQAAADFFRHHPGTGLMYGKADYVDAAGTRVAPYHTEEFDLDRLAAANIICQPAAFFRRDAFEAVGGLDESLAFVMDYDLWLRIAKQAPCHHLPRVLATYRLHEHSKTVSSATLYSNCEESLAVTMRHCGWAPLTRVFTSCRALCQARLPRLLGRNRLACAAATAFCAIIRSLYLNRGVRRNDLKLLTGENFRKLFKSRMDIMTGRTP